ncbi:ATP-binding protein [Streptomyces monticola]|uniref:ATP-binding protein n=1 Tax=Streptomyces monticola TaxID=2666263 RepID=A0ABW2JBB3_9ACTN
MHAHRRAGTSTSSVEYRLDRDPVSAGRARRLTAAFLARVHGSGAEVNAEAVDDVTLVVSELVANATEHGRGGCRLRLESSAHRVTVEVQDDGPGRPRPGVQRASGERGRGLSLVRRLAERFEVEAAAGGGKTVRAIVAG